MLWAVLFAGAAFGTVGHGSGLFLERGDLDVLKNRAEFLLCGSMVVASKRGGNIHAVRAGHTVAAAGTANFEIAVDFRANRVDQPMVGISESVHLCLIGGIYVFPYHIQGIHSGEDAGYLRLIPKPVERPSAGVRFTG